MDTDSGPYTDQEILDIILIQKKQDEGYRLLWRKYGERIYWHIRRMLVFHEDANDVCQEVFIKIFNALPSFQRKSALYTWMYTISTRECLDFIRAKKGKGVLLDADTLTFALKGDAYFDGDDAEILFWKAMETLPNKQKIVFKMRYFDEMPYKEIAEILQTSEGALKASYHHAQNKIQEYVRRHQIS